MPLLHGFEGLGEENPAGINTSASIPRKVGLRKGLWQCYLNRNNRLETVICTWGTEKNTLRTRMK